MTKKIVLRKAFAFIANLLLVIVFATGCSQVLNYDLFKVSLTSQKDRYFIYGFTKDYTEKILYIPEFINGKKISGIGMQNLLGAYSTMKSKTIEKVVLPNYEIDLRYAFPYLDNLKSIVFSWNGEWEGASFFDKVTLYNKNATLFIPAQFMDQYKSGNYFEESIHSYMDVANVEYYYNYEESPNDGIYLADHLEEGEEIYLEASPTREGNQFGGWYAEPNCVTELKTGALFHGEDVLKLYAKWNS